MAAVPQGSYASQPCVPVNRISGALRSVAPASRQRVLFVGEATSLSHVVRPAVLARWAREAGHEVLFACGPRYAGVARSENFDPVDLMTIEASRFYGRLAKGRFFYSLEELRQYVRAELGLIRRFRPDLVVGDFRLTLPVSARLAGVECLSLANAYWSPEAERRLVAPEGGVLGLLPHFLREALLAAAKPLAYRFFAAPLDRLRRNFGLPVFKDFREHYTAGDFCAYLDLPELFPAFGIRHSAIGTTVVPKAESPKPRADLPAGHFFLGPVPWTPRGVPEPDLGDLGLERPLAYVSMGSTGDGRSLPKALRALLDAGCDLAVSGVRTAEAVRLRQELPGLAGRALVAEFFSPEKVLSRARLAVCHGGSGTIYQALAAAVPVLCLPSNPDQRLASEALERSGGGMVATPKRLGDGIEAVLRGECAHAARCLAQAVRLNDARRRWLRFLGEGGALQAAGHATCKHLRYELRRTDGGRLAAGEA